MGLDRVSSDNNPPHDVDYSTTEEAEEVHDVVCRIEDPAEHVVECVHRKTYCVVIC